MERIVARVAHRPLARVANLVALLEKPRIERIATDFCACFLSMSAPLMTYVLHGYYGFGAVEVWIAFGMVAAFAALYTMVHLRVGQVTQRLLEMALIMLLVDLFFESRLAPALLGLAWLAAGLYLKASPHKVMAVFGSVALLASIVTGLIQRKPWISAVTDHTAKATGAAAKSPVIVHIILDEHIGLAGFPKSPAGQQAAREFQKFYRAQGFSTYERAYSRHYHTINAIPDILNFGRRLGQSGTPKGGVVGPTDYLTGLRRAGYELTIHQSNYLDLCAGARAKRCVTHDRGSLQPMAGLGLSTSDRLEILNSRYLGASDLLSQARDFYRLGNFGEWAKDRPRPQSFKMVRESWSIAGLRAMDLFVADLKQARPGNAYFIHSLFPHFPYVTERNCTVKRVSDWRRRREARLLAERQEAYYDQLHCAARLVGLALAALKDSPSGGNAIVIVHGDHGSRILNVNPIEKHRSKIGPDQLVSSFSTLFAVRLPGEQQRNHAGFVAAPKILQALVLNDFKAVPELPAETRPSVILDNTEWKPTQPMDLPTDW